MRAPSDMPRRRRRRRVSNRGRIALIVVAAVLFLLFTSLRGIASFWTDYLWFDSVQLSSVFTTVVGSKITLAAIFTLAFFLLMWLNLAIADRIAPKFRPTGPEDELLNRYHAMVDRRAGLIRATVSLGFALLAGVSLSAEWESWLLFINAKDFAQRDAIFDTDVGFYVFKLPFYTTVVGWLFAALVIILLVTMVAHYLNGGIRLQAPFQRVTPQVKAHMSVLLAALALVKAVDYWLQRYELVFSTRGTVDGATYTDVKAQLPAIYLLLLISLLACGLFIFNIWQRGWVLPVVAVGLWALVAVVAGTAYPAFVQRFQVTPDESAKERPYIQNNIQATRQAYGLTADKIEVKQFEYDQSREAAARGVRNNPATIRNVRLLDPKRVPDTYTKLQGFQNFYRFNDLDVDRYKAQVPGSEQIAETLTVVSARDLNLPQIPQQTWENRVLAYTHGYGLAMANASAVNPSGDPDFIVSDIPVREDGGLQASVDQPFLYFGEFPGASGSYAIADTLRDEVAYVDRNQSTVYERYQGDGGVVLDSWLRKAAFALRFADWNPLLSNFVTDNSKMIFVRDVHDRVEAAAPFLDWDANPYPIIANGRVVYVIDGYTSTDNYPNSQRAVADGLPDRSTLVAPKRFNYIRNSVKATVDAYDGTIKLYVWDPSDPIVSAYQSAFPTLFSPSDQMPGDVYQHVRYPEDLFRLQTNMWGRYRLDSPDAFYQRTGAWSVASEPPTTPQGGAVTTTTTAAPAGAFGAQQQQPVPARGRGPGIDPNYVLLKLPKESRETFALMREFVPVGDTSDVQQNLTSFMVAKSDPDNDYGKLIVYEVPTQNQVSGPVIVNSKILQNEAVSTRITQLNQQGSKVDFGSMLLLPLDSSVIWVRPLYVTSDNTQKVPQLKNVIVVLNDEVVMRPTLKEALTDLLRPTDPNIDVQTYETQKAPDASSSTTPGASTTTTTQPGSTSSSTTTTTTPPAGGGDAQQLLDRAAQLYDEADAALRAGDLATYQQKVNEAADDVRRARQLLSSDAGSSTTSTTQAVASA
ncbi:MAG: UPF0182 family protein [Acidimicrobiales bacterium]